VHPACWIGNATGGEKRFPLNAIVHPFILYWHASVTLESVAAFDAI
jgi:hypothetical protein